MRFLLLVVAKETGNEDELNSGSADRRACVDGRSTPLSANGRVCVELSGETINVPRFL